MMLILFLVCILATLVTVHRAACYRSIQDARRNTPLRHFLPLAEDRPPPYITNSSADSADGLSQLVSSVLTPKPQAETPPPSYEEALYRQSVRMPEEDVEAGLNPSASSPDPPASSSSVTASEPPTEQDADPSSTSEQPCNVHIENTSEAPVDTIDAVDNETNEATPHDVVTETVIEPKANDSDSDNSKNDDTDILEVDAASKLIPKEINDQKASVISEKQFFFSKFHLP